MSPNLGQHCVSLRHRRGPHIPNLYQLLSTSTNQPKHTGTLALSYHRVIVFEIKQQSQNYRHVGNPPTCRQMSCRFGHPANTTLSCVCDMTSDVSRHVADTTQNVAVWATKSTRRHPTCGAKPTNMFIKSTATTTNNTTATRSSSWYPDSTTHCTPYPEYNNTFFECCIGAFASQPSGVCVEDIDSNSNMNMLTTPIAPPTTSKAHIIPASNINTHNTEACNNKSYNINN